MEWSWCFVDHTSSDTEYYFTHMHLLPNTYNSDARQRMACPCHCSPFAHSLTVLHSSAFSPFPSDPISFPGQAYLLPSFQPLPGAAKLQTSISSPISSLSYWPTWLQESFCHLSPTCLLPATPSHWVEPTTSLNQNLSSCHMSCRFSYLKICHIWPLLFRAVVKPLSPPFRTSVITS